MKGDQVDQAIAAAETPAPAPYTQVNLTLGGSTGRLVMLGVPSDLTMPEVLELTAWVASRCLAHLAETADQASILQIARGMPDGLARA